MNRNGKNEEIIGVIIAFAVIGFFVWLMMVNLIIGIIVFVSFLGILLAIALRKRDYSESKAKENKSKETKEIKNKEKLDVIISEIKKRTEMEYYKVSFVEEETNIYSSKLGGLPYWDLSKDYPQDSKGNKLILLAQINFEKENLEDERLPKEGMLQFFIRDDDTFGCNFNDVQDNWKVIYHQKIVNDISEDKIKVLDIPTNKTAEISPIEKDIEPLALKFEKNTGVITTGTYNFENIFKDILKEKYGEEITEKNLYSYFENPDYEYIMNSFEAFGHKLLGYPDFTQYDIRNEDTKYDTLLFQIDSDKKIMWGDMGVANFFINSKDLKNKDFSKVLYTWDCG